MDGNIDDSFGEPTDAQRAFEEMVSDVMKAKNFADEVANVVYVVFFPILPYDYSLKQNDLN